MGVVCMVVWEVRSRSVSWRAWMMMMMVMRRWCGEVGGVSGVCVRRGHGSWESVRVGVRFGSGACGCRVGSIGSITVSRCWLQRLMAFIGLSVTTFSSFRKIMLSGTELLREVVRVIDAELSHHFLLFRRAWLSSRKRVFEDRRSIRSNWSPFMKLLAEEISLICQ